MTMILANPPILVLLGIVVVHHQVHLGVILPLLVLHLGTTNMLTLETIKTILNENSVAALSYQAKELYCFGKNRESKDNINQLSRSAGFLDGAAKGLCMLGYNCPVSTLTQIIQECDAIQGRGYLFCTEYAGDVTIFVKQLLTAAQLVRMVADTIRTSKKQEQYSFHIQPHTWFEIARVSSKTDGVVF